MRRFVLWMLFCSAALASSYQSGKLLSITDSSSNRIVSNSQTGAVATVTDVEYRLSVQIGDMVYVGSYWPRWRWSYAPTDFIVNDPVEARLDGKHMYLKRPDGKELKTEIIRRVHAGSESNPKADNR